MEQSKEARKKLPVKKWILLTIEVILLLVTTGAVIITAQLFVGNIMLAIMGVEALSQPVAMAVYSVLSYLLAVLIIIILPYVCRKKIKKLPHDLGLTGWPTWTDIALAPVAYGVYLVGASALMALFSLLPWFNAAEAQNLGFSTTLAGGDRIIAFIILVIIAPIVEEIIFRGWLYHELRKDLNKKMPKWLNIAISVFLTSLLFGIVHLQWNVGVNVFVLSVVLCLLRELTGTTYAGILLHMLKNGLAFYLLYVLGV